MKLSLEAKVGLLILAAAVLLGGFLFLLGGVSFEDNYAVFVEFDNPGSVQPGAAVRIGGVKVGTVESVEYLGRRLDPDTGRRPLVKMRLSVHESVRDTVHRGDGDGPLRDLTVYVTSQGVLGEQFIAMDPGDPSTAVLEDGETVVGVDPPRLDEAMALGFELLEAIAEGVRNNRDELETFLEDIIALIHALRLIVVEHQDDVDTIVENVVTLSREGVETLRTAREAYVDGERPQRIMRNLDSAVARVDREAPGLIEDVRRTTHNVNDVLDTFGPEQRQQFQNTLASAERLSANAETTLDDANEVMRHIREGRGTVGGLLMDEEIYDDLQELIRDLKHNPWKFFWRE